MSERRGAGGCVVPPPRGRAARTMVLNADPLATFHSERSALNFSAMWNCDAAGTRAAVSDQRELF